MVIDSFASVVRHVVTKSVELSVAAKETVKLRLFPALLLFILPCSAVPKSTVGVIAEN
jgi:hypothetical protein